MKRTVSTLIVGGGVIGLSLAWELAQRGRSVVVLEAGSIGRGASWAGAGILPPPAQHGTVDPYERLRALSHELHPQWAARLRFATGIDTGYRRCGGIYLASTPAESATLTASRWWWQEHGIEHQAWTVDEISRREPDLMAGRQATSPTNLSGSSGFRAVWFLPDECQLRNPRHLQALAAACRQEGVELIEQAKVTKLLSNQADGVQVVSEACVYQAEQVCICSGAWARHTLEQLGLSNGIMPVRGQMILYRCQRPLLHSIVNEGHRYLVARSDGRLLAGSIEEEVGYVVETTKEGLAQIQNWAENILPQLKEQPIEKTWAGLRPGSFDGFPYIGRVPGHSQLYLAAGHFRSGLHLSCATAVVTANVMEGKDNTIDLHPFRIGRG